MQTYDYTDITASNAARLTAELKKRGAEGWRAVWISPDGKSAIVEREKGEGSVVVNNTVSPMGSEPLRQLMERYSARQDSQGLKDQAAVSEAIGEPQASAPCDYPGDAVIQPTPGIFGGFPTLSPDPPGPSAADASTGEPGADNRTEYEKGLDWAEANFSKDYPGVKVDMDALSEEREYANRHDNDETEDTTPQQQ